jgi:hypothetical protein
MTAIYSRAKYTRMSLTPSGVQLCRPLFVTLTTQAAWTGRSPSFAPPKTFLRENCHTLPDQMNAIAAPVFGNQLKRYPAYN